MKVQGPKELSKFIELTDVIQGIRDAMRQHMRTRLREHNYDITFEMLEVLLVLWKRDKRNQQEIADAVRKNKASLTSLLDNLTARKLVFRHPDPNDRRNNIISLTKEGIAYEDKLVPLITEFYETFRDDFEGLQLDIITQSLKQLYSSILEKGKS